MAQLQLKSLLGKANAILEKSTNLFGYVVVNKDEMSNLIEEIVACIPADIKEAEMLISRKEEIVREANNRAERIIQDAVNEQARLVSNNEVMMKVQDAVTKQKQQVDEYCENVQNSAVKNAEEIKIMAIREAAKIQEGAEAYAERIFNEMAANISQVLNNVNICQRALAEQKSRHQGQRPQEQNVQEQPDQEQEEV